MRREGKVSGLKTAILGRDGELPRKKGITDASFFFWGGGSSPNAESFSRSLVCVDSGGSFPFTIAINKDGKEKREKYLQLPNGQLL